MLTPEFRKQDCFTCLRLAFPIKPLRCVDGDKRFWVVKHEAPESVFRLAAVLLLVY